METKPKNLVKQARKRFGNSTSTVAIMMVVCTLLVVASFVISKQLVGDLRFNNKVISAKNKVNSTLEHNVEVLPELEKNYEQLLQGGPQPKDIMSALPSSPDYPALAGEYEAMAALSGVQLVGISIESDQVAAEDSGEPTAVEVQFRVTATGTYAKLQDMLKKLEVADRPVSFRQLSFTGSDPTVIMELALTSYYQGRTIISDQTETLQ